MEAEREFMIWRSGLDRDLRRWEAAPKAAKKDALLMGLTLAQAQSWLTLRGEDLGKAERDFINDSNQRDFAEREHRERLRRRTWQMGALLGVLFLGIAAGLAWSSRAYLKAEAVMLSEKAWPKVLTPETEQALKPGDHFKECSDCPEMVVVPPGEFTMGSPASEMARFPDEDPQHEVKIERAFAVSRFEVTFKEWETCVLLGGCPNPAWDQRWGRGRRPVINVNWDDAQRYVAWLSRMTGRPYRLLSEAEWEYAARAGTQTAYPWGDEIGTGHANCKDCGSQWDHKQTAPVGSFAPNKFGLYDMLGNVYEWVEDCWHGNYDGAPADGSAWITGNCSYRVVRGGSWFDPSVRSRAANRSTNDSGFAAPGVGIRVARTVSTGTR